MKSDPTVAVSVQDMQYMKTGRAEVQKAQSHSFTLEFFPPGRLVWSDWL